MWLLYFFFKSYTVDENNWFYKLVNGLEIIFLSQQIFYIKASFAYPRRVVRRQQTSYAKRFPFILISNVVLSLPGRHSALSVRHIESTNRKRGNRICFEFPLLSLHSCWSPTIACFPLKLTIQISSRVLDYDLRR